MLSRTTFTCSCSIAFFLQDNCNSKMATATATDSGKENVPLSTSAPGKTPSGALKPGYTIGPNGVILGPDGKPCRVS